MLRNAGLFKDRWARSIWAYVIHSAGFGKQKYLEPTTFWQASGIYFTEKGFVPSAGSSFHVVFFLIFKYKKI